MIHYFQKMFTLLLMKKTGIQITHLNSHGLTTNVADFGSLFMRL